MVPIYPTTRRIFPSFSIVRTSKFPNPKVHYCYHIIIIIIIIIIIGIQPLGRSGQRPEFSQATGMALVRCILGKFLGVACPCFPPLFRCSHFSPPGASTSATTWEIPAAQVGTVIVVIMSQLKTIHVVIRYHSALLVKYSWNILEGSLTNPVPSSGFHIADPTHHWSLSGNNWHGGTEYVR